AEATPEDSPAVSESTRILVQIGSYTLKNLTTGAETVMDALPVIQDGRTLLPVRFMAIALGAEVDWNPAASEVTITLDDVSLTFAIGESALGMEVPAQILDERTMVPLRFIGEFFGADIEWNPETSEIILQR
ncbi:MAG: copper amine oxidase N-terminal domain-containing protein, partial [Defluviitaleaceae bacterium]|nr:copper amine oxidase N-terminal domain-containing protein [Defluviitaleaceae bacterium]